jgi:glycosyltransferase involved in cell wall biosynthesis
VRIAHFNNIANDALHYVLALRRHGEDAYLVFERDAHEFSRPEWELPNILGESWIRPVDNLSGKAGLIGPRFAKTVLELSRYDLISAWDVGPIWAQWAGKPYMAHTAGGDLFAAVASRTPRQRLLRRAYEHANCLVYYLPYQEEAIARLKIRRIVFARLPIDEDRYSPGPVPDKFSHLRGFGTLFFCPSRHNWELKGTDVMLKAYADALKVEKDMHLVLTGWGGDLMRSRELSEHLGLNDRITWLSTLNKDDLIGMYRTCDVVLDQFVLGSYGTTTIEALMCGRPVVIRVERYEAHYEGDLPFVNVRTQGDITNAMVELAQDHSLLKAKGDESRLWALKYHSYRSVSAEYMKLASEVLG